MACHSAVIFGRQGCPPTIWLKALSRKAVIEKSTSIRHSSPMVLIKSQKIYNKGRLLSGPDHEFVRVRRAGAIPHVKFEANQDAVQFVLTLHMSQEHTVPIQPLYHQAISNALIYAGMRESQRIRGKYLRPVRNVTDRSNCGTKKRSPQAKIMGSPPTIVKYVNSSRHISLCSNPMYPQNAQKEMNRGLDRKAGQRTAPKPPAVPSRTDLRQEVDMTCQRRTYVP